MNSESVEVSLKKAEESSALLSDLLGSIRPALEALQEELKVAKEENLSLTKVIQTLRSENRALHIVRNKLLAERASDKEVIQLWSKQLNIESIQSEGSTQENAASDAVIPSSPPGLKLGSANTEQFAKDSLSQRLLPMSIGIGDLIEDGEPSPSEESYAADHKADLNAVQHIKSEYQDLSETQSTPSRTAQDSESNSQKSQIKEETPHKRKYLEVRDSNYHAWREELLSREWHPADFKLNPFWEENDALEGKRSKQHDECLHSTNKFNLRSMSRFDETAHGHGVDLDEHQTPPGYWNMDFPESSQIEAEKTEMRQQFLDIGRRRLMEALRGGRYMFKDQDLNQQNYAFHKK